MQTKRFKTLKQYWNLEDLGLIKVVSKQDLESFLRFNSIRDILSMEEMSEWEKVAIKERKNEWLLGRFASKKLIKFYFEKKLKLHISLTDTEILGNKNKKPTIRIAHCNFQVSDFSISHSDNYAAAAITTKPNLKVGIDIEKTRIMKDKVFGHFLLNSEIAQIKKSLNKNRMATIFWTLKEASLKAIGIGLKGSLKGIKVLSLQELKSANIFISKSNLKIAKLREPTKIHCFWDLFNDYNLSVVFLEN